MPSLYTNQTSNVRKTWLLMLVFLVLIIAIGFFFSQIYGNPVILYFAIIFSLVVNLISYWHSDKIALATAGAKHIPYSDNPELHRIVENLCITAGLKKPRIYLINDPAPNAFATGRNQDNAAIAVTTGLMERLDRSELEGVIAHELSHIGNRDILLQTVVVVLVGFVALLSDMFLRSMIWGRGGNNDRDGRAQIVIILVGVVLAILTPIAAMLIQLAISRKREFLADASGALLTRYPEGLASALEKISQDQHQLRRANKATAHLYITSPFKGKRAKSWFTKLFMTHPPVEERIKALRN
ncbi:MAG: M48 family metallopeptidase [Patescibacteria group bacterium]